MRGYVIVKGTEVEEDTLGMGAVGHQITLKETQKVDGLIGMRILEKEKDVKVVVDSAQGEVLEKTGGHVAVEVKGSSIRDGKITIDIDMLQDNAHVNHSAFDALSEIVRKTDSNSHSV